VTTSNSPGMFSDLTNKELRLLVLQQQFVIPPGSTRVSRTGRPMTRPGARRPGIRAYARYPVMRHMAKIIRLSRVPVASQAVVRDFSRHAGNAGRPDASAPGIEVRDAGSR
jgi:hypothetical protein